MKQSIVTLKVSLDENHVPENIQWQASDNQNIVKEVKAFSLSIWDEKEQNALALNLWTKEMEVDEMKLFYFQQFMMMADNYEKATNDVKMSDVMRDFATFFAEENKLIQKQ